MESGAIGDFIWYDANGNGIEDVGEPGIGNVTVDLYVDTDNNGVYSGGDTLVDSTVTDSNGGYLFTGLIPETYFVVVTDLNGQLTGLTLVVGNQSLMTPTGPINLAANEVFKDADFGYVQNPGPGNAIIGDTVFYDANGDGVQQPSELGIPGVQVCANPTGGGFSICSTTDDNGHYRIVVPAGSYDVAPTNPPAGYSATTPSPQPVTVAAGEQYLDADFGYDSASLLGSIGNLIFRDVVVDGVFSGGSDEPLGGVDVCLIADSNGDGVWQGGEPIVATTVSAGALSGSGNYLFPGVPAGDYLVNVCDTNGVLFDYTQAPLGTPGADNHNQADPYAVELSSGENELTADFGFVQAEGPSTGLIGNQVWIDADGDGVFDPNAGDVGQPGVTVDLYRNGVFWAKTTTGAAGEYAFLHLPSGNYTVQVTDDFQVLYNLVLAPFGPNPGQDNNNQEQPYAVVLAEGGVNLTADFGYLGEGTGQGEGLLGDFVWWDADKDGLQDLGEPGIPNVQVNLYDGSNQLLASTATNALGLYEFVNLDPGLYRIEIDASEFLAGGDLVGTSPSPRFVGVDPLIDSNGNLVTHDDLVTLGFQESNTTIDFGFYASGDYLLTKQLNTAEPVQVGDPVSFTITITNLTDRYLGVVPLQDIYDTNYLTYGNAGQFSTPASDNNTDDGQIDWSDLVVSFGQQLAPGGSWSVDVWFTAKADTTNLLPDGQTENRARVEGALIDPDGPGGALPPLLPLPAKEASDRVEIFKPTGVGAYGLTAHVQADDSVVVSWKTASEANLLGFNVLRSATEAGPYGAVNDGVLLAAQSGMNAGNPYVFRDETADGKSYWYKLEVLRVDGITETLGPVVAVILRYLYLPLMNR